MKRKAECHPDRKYYAKGKCFLCYMSEWNKKNRERNRQRNTDRMRVYRSKDPERFSKQEHAGYERRKAAVPGYLEKRRGASFAWRVANPEKRLAIHLKHRYGISMDDYVQMYERQDGRCYICSTLLESPHVDHCHETGRVRGLLCKGCNTMIGQAKDNPKILMNSIAYLSQGVVS